MSVKQMQTRNAPGGGEPTAGVVKELQDNVKELVTNYRRRSEELEARVKKFEQTEGEQRSELEKWKTDLAGQISGLSSTVEELGKIAARSQAHGSGKDHKQATQEQDELQVRGMSLLFRNKGDYDLALKNVSNDELEKRALSSLSGTEGGYLVPKFVEQQIIQKVYELAGTRKVVQGIPTSSPLVTNIKGSAVSVTVGDETDPFADQAHKFEMDDVRIYDIKACIYIPNNLLDDNSFNLVQYLTENVSSAIAEKEDQLFAVGTGSKQPRGIFVHPDLTTAVYNKSSNPSGFYKTGVAATLNDGSNNGTDVLKLMPTTVKSGYRMGAVWQMNSLTMAVVSNLKDSTGNYLWNPGVDKVTGSLPGSLAGYPISINEFIDDIGAGKFPIGFGNLAKAYRIYDRSGLTTWQDNSVRRLQDQTAFGFKKRLGGDTVQSLAFKLLKVST